MESTVPTTADRDTRQARTRSGHEEPVMDHKFPATRVLMKELQSFKDRGIDAKSWVLINEKDGTRTHFNSYDGEAQPVVSAQLHDLSPKKIRQLGREYKEVDISECPFATAA